MSARNCVLPPYLPKYPSYQMAARVLEGRRKKGKNPYIWQCMFCKGYHAQFRDQ